MQELWDLVPYEALVDAKAHLAPVMAGILEEASGNITAFDEAEDRLLEEIARAVGRDDSRRFARRLADKHPLMFEGGFDWTTGAHFSSPLRG